MVKKQKSLFESQEIESIESDDSKGGLLANEEAAFNENAPLAHRVRPTQMSEFIGHSYIFKKYPYLLDREIPSLIIYGPAGTGKTTLARLIAKQSQKNFFSFSAVLGGVPELKKVIAEALKVKNALIFIDEIHRFNKAQQDALLPYVEDGSFTLIGATTENPRVSVNKALISRAQLIELKTLHSNDLIVILKNALAKINQTLDEPIIKAIAQFSAGDARNALNALANTLKLENPTIENVKEVILQNSRAYDKDGNRHYDVISAFIKSMRGSDPSAAILWLAIMIDGGEDPVFIARRLVIFASEDVGNADPNGLTVALNALTGISQIGMPEARIILAQATTYLASTYKSNASYLAINEALSFVSENQTVEVPDHLKNFPPPYAKKYDYPHNHPNHWVKQEYKPQGIPDFYRPTTQGREEGLKKRLDSLK